MGKVAVVVLGFGAFGLVGVLGQGLFVGVGKEA